MTDIDPPWDEDLDNPAVQVRQSRECGARIARMQTALEFIAGLPPGSRGAYAKFREAQSKAREVLGLKIEHRAETKTTRRNQHE